jgi:TM2 domain-containing membrane protein YozV
MEQYMPCVNHPEASVQAYCQSCGKALCANCVRTTPNGQILCDTCVAAGAANPGQTYWHGVATGFGAARGVPNPAAAAILGIIPGVGAMYNGQLFKGLIHVIIFAVLVSLSDHFGVFGIFVAAWVIYQSFEAFHTAKARRDGLPLPDPFGLNEVGNWFNMSGLGLNPRGTPGAQPGPPPGQQPGQPTSYPGYAPGQTYPGTGPAGTGIPNTGPVYGQSPTGQTADTPAYSAAWTGTEYQQGYQTYPNYQAPPYAEPYAGSIPPGSNPAGAYQAGSYPAGGYNPADYPPGSIPPIPPIPPLPPYNWRRREPVWAILLIVLGVLFLLQTMGVIAHHFFHYAWPVMLIAIGVWLIVRRLGPNIGGSK